MHISPYFRLAFFALLATLVPLVNGKGGGGGGSGSSSGSSGSSGSITTGGSSSSSGTGYSVFGSSTSPKPKPRLHKVCVDATTNQVVKCPIKPLSKGATIAIATIFTVVGLVILGLLVSWYYGNIRRHLKKRAQETRSINNDSEQGAFGMSVTPVKEGYSYESWDTKHQQSSAV